MSYLIDSHCHLHDQEWFTPEQAEELIASARENQVEKIITIGTDPEDSENARRFAGSHENVFWTYGIHPEFASKITISALDDAVSSLKASILTPKIPNLPAVETDSSAANSDTVTPPNDPTKDEMDASREFRENKNAPELDTQNLTPAKADLHMALEKSPHHIASSPVAIGEIGLDYHYDGYDREAQIRLFERLLQLASDLDLPVALHIRDAFDDAFPVLDNFPQLTGVVHSFTGSKKILRQVLARDFYVGVNGLATYCTLPLPPLEKMILETDAPFLTPTPFRGTMNKPEYVRLVAKYLSEKMGITEALIAEQTTKNVQGLFHI